MSYWLHPDAEAFLTEFEKTLSLMVENPFLGTANNLGLCSYHFKHFPYTIIFQKDSDGPQVFAVAHQHHRPGYWLERI